MTGTAEPVLLADGRTAQPDGHAPMLADQAALAARGCDGAALPAPPGRAQAAAVLRPAAAPPSRRRRRGVQGTVYLLHFSVPYGPGGGANGRGTARHYTGWAPGGAHGLARRLAKHGTSEGARLMQVVQDAGITWELARTWPGDRNRERQLKRQGGAARRCPLCGVAPRPGDLPTNADGSVSRSRTTDLQKQAAGVMTTAQQAEHTALRRGATGRTPPEQQARVRRLRPSCPEEGAPGVDPWASPGPADAPLADRPGVVAAAAATAAPGRPPGRPARDRIPAAFAVGALV